MLTVILGEGTVIPEVMVVAVVAVRAVVEVDTVNVEVAVTVVNPPKAAKRSIVERGSDARLGQVPDAPPDPLQVRLSVGKSGDLPTIHPLDGDNM